jgi:putative transposase
MLHRFEWAAKTDKRITNYKFWQESNHAIGLEPIFPDIFKQKLDYIHNNPVRAGIVDEACKYLYSSARDYMGKRGLVNVTLAM